MSTGNKLVLFTNSYPYGNGEQFLETEINYLSEAFSKIYIYPLAFDSQIPRVIPQNAKVVKFELYNSHKRVKTLLRNFLFVNRIFVVQFFATKHKWIYIKKWKTLLFYLLDRLNDSELLKKELKKYDENSVLYSYWFNTWANCLSLLKVKDKLPFVVRIHGNDYDEIQQKSGFFPFREFFYKQNLNIVAVSNYGLNYLKTNFNTSTVLNRLGIPDHGTNKTESDKQPFVIVSCNFILPIKRVELIIDIISKLATPVKWIHFGNGELEYELEIKNYAKLKLQNTPFEFRGYTPNSEIIAFYKNNSVAFFISMSEVEEGNPVSIMEAISFGIPAIGCNAGGVSEIVTAQTGFLFDKDVDTKEVARILDNYFNFPEVEKNKLRNSSKEFWNQYFNAEINYKKFISTLKSPSKK